MPPNNKTEENDFSGIKKHICIRIRGKKLNTMDMRKSDTLNRTVNNSNCNNISKGLYK